MKVMVLENELLKMEFEFEVYFDWATKIQSERNSLYLDSLGQNSTQ
jgi:hypothetical protein